jgi:hypothetical protein
VFLIGNLAGFKIRRKGASTGLSCVHVIRRDEEEARIAVYATSYIIMQPSYIVCISIDDRVRISSAEAEAVD